MLLKKLNERNGLLISDDGYFGLSVSGDGKILSLNKCCNLCIASLTAVASFSTAEYCYLQWMRLQDIHATGQLQRDKTQLIASRQFQIQTERPLQPRLGMF